ncbi:6-cysteine protein, partial [Hepatocystis sp. ex Piliocolobus tephrosceles]
MKNIQLSFYYFLCCIAIKYVRFCVKAQDIFTIGHIKICTLHSITKKSEECKLDNEFGKTLLFIFDEAIDPRARAKYKIHPPNCLDHTYMNVKDANENLNSVDTYDIFQNLFGYVSTKAADTITIYSTPYSNKQVNFSCMFLSEQYPGVKYVMKINFNKNIKKIKGCDFGDNVGEKRELTNTLSLSRNSNCYVYAYPGDVVGLNCYKKEKNSPYNTDVEMLPKNCFHNVYYEENIILSTQNLVVGSRVVPDYTIELESKKNHPSYMIIPENIKEDVTFFCTCRNKTNVGTMYVLTNNMDSTHFAKLEDNPGEDWYEFIPIYDRIKLANYNKNKQNEKAKNYNGNNAGNKNLSNNHNNIIHDSEANKMDMNNGYDINDYNQQIPSEYNVPYEKYNNNYNYNNGDYNNDDYNQNYYSESFYHNNGYNDNDYDTSNP